MKELEIAQNLVSIYFKDKKDKGGSPYLEHLYYVSKRGRNEKEQIIGLLHDILEDTPLTVNDLLRQGISKEVVLIVTLLTKSKNTSYESYINRLIKSGLEEALYIKKIDMEHNMDLTRIPNITEKDITRLEQKYQPNYQKICEALTKLEQKKLIKTA